MYNMRDYLRDDLLAEMNKIRDKIEELKIKWYLDDLKTNIATINDFAAFMAVVDKYS